MKGDLLLDGRNLYEPRAVAEARLRYLGIGRGVPFPPPRRLPTDVVTSNQLEKLSA